MFLTNIIVFSLKTYIVLDFSEQKCMVGTSKRIIFLALPCMYLTTRLTCFCCSSSHIGTEVNVFLANLGQTLIARSFGGEWAGFGESESNCQWQKCLLNIRLKKQIVWHWLYCAIWQMSNSTASSPMAGNCCCTTQLINLSDKRLLVAPFNSVMPEQVSISC